MNPLPKLYRCPVFISIFFLLFAGGVALCSRSRYFVVLNSFFKEFVGAEYQSWFEHFLSGFASTSLAFILIVGFVWFVSHFSDGKPERGVFVKKILDWVGGIIGGISRWRVFEVCLIFCCLIYTLISLYWECEQYFERNYFQTGQFLCDLAGAVIWGFVIRWLTPKQSET